MPSAMTSMRRAALATLTVALTLSLGCARPPRPTYSFDTAPGGWELASHQAEGPRRAERYRHAVHGEGLEIFEIQRAAPAVNSAGFAALGEGARLLPALGHADTSVPRERGDDEVSGAAGYWVEQHGREDEGMSTAAVFVVPRGGRHYIARMSSREDEFGQLQGWLRDILLRNVRFPAQ